MKNTHEFDMIGQFIVAFMATIGGLGTFLKISVPTANDMELFGWKFIGGLIASIVYAVVGYYINRWLKKRNEKHEQI